MCSFAGSFGWCVGQEDLCPGLPGAQEFPVWWGIPSQVPNLGLNQAAWRHWSACGRRGEEGCAGGAGAGTEAGSATAAPGQVQGLVGPPGHTPEQPGFSLPPGPWLEAGSHHVGGMCHNHKRGTAGWKSHHELTGKPCSSAPFSSKAPLLLPSPPLSPFFPPPVSPCALGQAPAEPLPLHASADPPGKRLFILLRHLS